MLEFVLVVSFAEQPEWSESRRMYFIVGVAGVEFYSKTYI
jgi:hypothetical protein